MQDIHQRARGVRLAAFDVDGVLTDGRLYYSARGEELKVFDVKDGHGLKMLQAAGVTLALVTSRSSQAVALRAANLGIDLVFQGVENKLATLDALLGERGLRPEDAFFMGDDYVDLAVMRHCGFACTVPDAPRELREAAHYVTGARGGRGAVREACEFVLRAQERFDVTLGLHGA
jgi:3-deoxy-D-manno-octulosonate 8-phosphate phosphatase (KDO 8-P phosphatase)